MPRTRKTPAPKAPAVPTVMGEELVCQVRRLSDLGPQAPTQWVLEARRALDAGLQVFRVKARADGGRESLLTANPGVSVAS